MIRRRACWSRSGRCRMARSRIRCRSPVSISSTTWIVRPSGDKREIVHTFEAPYPIAALEIAVQQPGTRDRFQRDTGAQQHNPGGRRSDLSHHRAGEPGRRRQARHRDQLRQNRFRPLLAAACRHRARPWRRRPPPLRSRNNTASKTSWLPIVLIVVGVLALIGIGVYWFLSRRPASPADETAQADCIERAASASGRGL